MELNVSQYNTFNNYQNTISKNNNEIPLTKPVEKIDETKISLENSFANSNQTFKTNRSDISSELQNNISKISQLETSQKTINQQNLLIEKLQTTVLSDQNTNINTKAPQVSSIIDQYNTNATKIYSSLQEYYDEQKSDKSSIFFDGILGSIPLSTQEINEAIQEQKTTLTQINNELEQTKEKEIHYSKKLIKEQEIEQEIKSSNDYSAENLKQNLQNSMKDVQQIPINTPSFEITA